MIFEHSYYNSLNIYSLATCDLHANSLENSHECEILDK